MDVQVMIAAASRIVILGPPGSGKSRLAQHLGATRRLPVFHLDQAYWRPGWVAAESETFRAEIDRITGLPAWVIDGNYTDTIAPRFDTADTVIYLDVPSWLSMLRILRRILLTRGKVRVDMAAGCPERLDPAFLHFAWTWNRKRRARNFVLVESFQGRRIIITARDAIAAVEAML